MITWWTKNKQNVITAAFYLVMIFAIVFLTLGIRGFIESRKRLKESMAISQEFKESAPEYIYIETRRSADFLGNGYTVISVLDLDSMRIKEMAVYSQSGLDRLNEAIFTRGLVEAP